MFCSQNNWQAQPMMTLQDFCLKIDKKKPDFLEQMRDRSSCRQEVKSTSEFDETEKRRYNDMLDKHKRYNYDSSDDIKKVLLKNLNYREPELVNISLILELDADKEYAEKE